MSQERLAEEAEVSARHLSCLETGKAQPSRMMVLALGSALELPLRERNALLAAAGFAAAYGEQPLDAPDAAALRRAVDRVIGAVEPNGAVACDRAWNIVAMNGGAARLFAAFADVAAMPPEVARNVVLATLDPRGLRPAIVNFDEVAAFTLDRARREAARTPDDAALAGLRSAFAGLDLPPIAAIASNAPFVTVQLRRGALEARLFTTISTLGTPIDATAEEIRIESYFPADDATAALVRELALTGTAGPAGRAGNGT